MELLALVISLAALACNGFLFYWMRHRVMDVNVHLVVEPLPTTEDIPLQLDEEPSVPAQEPGESLAAWKNRTGIPFTDYGPPPPPIARPTPPPLARPGGFV